MDYNPRDPAITHMNRVWREAMADKQPSVEKFVTFILTDGQWDVQFWGNNMHAVSGKVFKIRIPVPAELVGPEIETTVEVS